MTRRARETSEWISVSAYARRRKCSRKAVDYAIAHFLRFGYDPKKGILPEVADAEWAANKDPRGGDHARANGNGTVTARSAALERLDIAKAERAELELAKARGEMVSKVEVERELTALAKRICEGVLAVPARVDAEISTMRSRPRIRARLTEELRRALQALSDEFGPS